MKKKQIIILLQFLISSLSYAQYFSIPYDGYERTYLVHLPTGYSETNDLPLIIAMHGGFGNAYNMENQSQLSVKADAENFIVVYPEGVVGGALNISSWNAGSCCGFASNSNVDDVGFIDSLLSIVISQYAIDTNRVYATGMSNGGFMSYRLACELSHRITAVAPVASSMTVPNCSPIRSVPIIHFHSYLDSNVPYQGGVGDGFSNHYNPSQDSILGIWENLNTCNNVNIIGSSEYNFTKLINCDCGTSIHHYITQDGGHSWPGGNQTTLGDPTSTFINANDLMWSFFQQYSLDCDTETSINKTPDDNNQISIFPNPTTGFIKIKISSIINPFVVTIYDRLGKVVSKYNNIKTFDLSDQPTGFYYIHIQTKSKVMTKKIILAGK